MREAGLPEALALRLAFGIWLGPDARSAWRN